MGKTPNNNICFHNNMLNYGGFTLNMVNLLTIINHEFFWRYKNIIIWYNIDMFNTILSVDFFQHKTYIYYIIICQNIQTPPQSRWSETNSSCMLFFCFSFAGVTGNGFSRWSFGYRHVWLKTFKEAISESTTRASHQRCCHLQLKSTEQTDPCF